MIKAGIVGATGYAGAELVRLLLGHPQVELTAISSVSFEGTALSEVYPSYRGLCDMVCADQDTVVEKCDVVFAALPHGLSQGLAQQCADHDKVFIDLGADFRLEDEETYKAWYDGEFDNKELHKQAVYGMPEFFRDEIKGKKLIANPGCYTTAVPMALAPAVVNHLVSVQGIIADCKSGTTGCGRKPSQRTHYPELNESFSAYKVANHRHCPEMEQTLTKLSGQKASVTFVPHLLPINRGFWQRVTPASTRASPRSSSGKCTRRSTRTSILCVSCQRAPLPMLSTCVAPTLSMCPSTLMKRPTCWWLSPPSIIW